jgi:phosphatidylserine/phosphatidylglycerophosphate/cardiolipin synthase-like enzyme/membrane protein DedA with SNARE-associated domain
MYEKSLAEQSDHRKPRQWSDWLRLEEWEHGKDNHMICRKGKNCWRSTVSDKVAFLIDGADYFEAFVRAARLARKTIYILGWDFDSRLILDRRDQFLEPIPPVGVFLNQLAEKTPSLHIHILSWDFPFVYWRERQWLPQIRLAWKNHERVYFRLDDEHPIGGSQHEKIVVIDDQIAFCGGFDLTINRWDSPEHFPEDPRRREPDGISHRPFHDVQMAVNGETAQALGARFRERWYRAVGQELPAPGDGWAAAWPPDLGVDIHGPCRISIARTLPAYKGQRRVQEVAQLYTDAIRAARRYIYIENQYLTVNKICRELGKRLGEKHGPEIVLVMPRKASGWLEQSTMDAIRRHHLQRLVKQDRYKKLAVYYPVVGDRQTSVYVHSKLMIVDDLLAILGSANLSNRSMGLDSECCLAVEAEGGNAIETEITLFRRRLMAEHLGVDVAAVAAAEQAEPSLQAVISRLEQAERGLVPLDGDTAPVLDSTAFISDLTYLDPERPFLLDRMMDYLHHTSRSKNGWPHLMKIGAVVLALLAMTAAWRWTPLSEWLTMERLAQWAGLVDARPLLIPMVIGAFVVGGLIFIPITLMVGATALLLPPWQSFACAMAGAVLNAAATYLVGRRLGQKTVQKLTGNKLERLNNYLGRRGIFAIALLRNLPIAPYTVVNIIAGTAGIPLTTYLLGTALGMLPGILAVTVFTNRILQVIKNPSAANIALAAAVILFMGMGLWWFRKRLRQRDVN